MAQVIEREAVLNEYDQIERMVERPSSYEEADRVAGRKLDRRKNYAIMKGIVHELSRWTQPCSGCSCDGDYGCSCCHERGAGCDECGYTGKRRNEYWTPILPQKYFDDGGDI